MDVPLDVVMGRVLCATSLKDMDPALLAFAILHEGAALGVDTTLLTRAMELAAYLHRDDVRGNRLQLPVDPYVTHPFRLVLRLVRYGCRDTAVLAAATLHDTVEDHPDEIVALLGKSPPGRAPTRAAVDRLAAAFGPDVAHIVSAVTNPPWPPGTTGDEALRLYRDHVAAAIAEPRVFLVKFADFVDNAGGLRHMTDEARRSRLERKYAPLVGTFRAALAAHRSSLPVGPDGLARIERHLAAIAGRLYA